MRITVRVVGVVVALGLLLAAVPLSAHHSFAAAFDENKPVNLQGTVTKVELVNPHAWIWLDVKGAGRQGGELGHRRRSPDQPVEERHHQVQLAGGHGDQAVRLSGQERRVQGRRRLRRVPGRPQGVHGRLGSRRRRQRHATNQNQLGAISPAEVERPGRPLVSLLRFFEWLGNTPWSIALHESRYVFLVVLTVHVLTLTRVRRDGRR